MSTTMPNASTIERKWYVLDAEGKSLDEAALTQAHQCQQQSGENGQQHGDHGQQQRTLNALDEQGTVLGQEIKVKKAVGRGIDEGLIDPEEDRLE